ncbi:MAG: MG284/MPN403 family protein [Anaerorhabdus sp.]
MFNKYLKLKDKEKVICYMFDSYRKSKRKMEARMNWKIEEKSEEYGDAYSFTTLIENAMETCSEDTQRIFNGEYVEKLHGNWYLEYYSRSTFYRLKHQAIDEFIDNLMLWIY